MIPTAQCHSYQRPNDIRYNVIKVKDPAIGYDALQELRTDPEDGCADEEGEVEGSSAGGVKDPVEAGREDEEGYAVQDFVVYYWVYLEAAEASVARYEEDKYEGN